MPEITIIGGHGKLALRLARLLVDAGHRVTSWVRNPDHVRDVEQTGAVAEVADVEVMDVEAIAQRLRGQDAVVWSAGAGGGNPDRTYAVDRDAAIRSMDAAVAAAVPRYVMVSYFYDRPDHGVPTDSAFFPYADAKAAADAYLRDTGLEWTILGPSRLTDDPGTGLIETRPAERSQVSRDDVAALALDVLGDEAMAGLTIDFNNGDRPIREVLDGLS